MVYISCAFEMTCFTRHEQKKLIMKAIILISGDVMNLSIWTIFTSYCRCM